VVWEFKRLQKAGADLPAVKIENFEGAAGCSTPV